VNSVHFTIAMCLDTGLHVPGDFSDTRFHWIVDKYTPTQPTFATIKSTIDAVKFSNTILM